MQSTYHRLVISAILFFVSFLSSPSRCRSCPHVFRQGMSLLYQVSFPFKYWNIFHRTVSWFSLGSVEICSFITHPPALHQSWNAREQNVGRALYRWETTALYITIYYILDWEKCVTTFASPSLYSLECNSGSSRYVPENLSKGKILHIYRSSISLVPIQKLGLRVSWTCS
jgi:hypothetical protein